MRLQLKVTAVTKSVLFMGTMYSWISENASQHSQSLCSARESCYVRPSKSQSAKCGGQVHYSNVAREQEPEVHLWSPATTILRDLLPFYSPWGNHCWTRLAFETDVV